LVRLRSGNAFSDGLNGRIREAQVNTGATPTTCLASGLTNAQMARGW
jgi:hypothetical protein